MVPNERAKCNYLSITIGAYHDGPLVICGPLASLGSASLRPSQPESELACQSESEPMETRNSLTASPSAPSKSPSGSSDIGRAERRGTGSSATALLPQPPPPPPPPPPLPRRDAATTPSPASPGAPEAAAAGPVASATRRAVAAAISASNAAGSCSPEAKSRC